MSAEEPLRKLERMYDSAPINRFYQPVLNVSSGVLTVSFNVYFIRPVKDGQLRALGRVVHSSRNLFMAESELVDDTGNSVTRGIGTFMKSRTALSGDIGYK